jgi:hypothetical protein
MKKLKILFILLFFHVVLFDVSSQSVIDSDVSENKQSISFEGYLHNNFVYQGNKSDFPFFKNQVTSSPDTNSAKLGPLYRLKYTLGLRKFDLMIGVDFDNFQYLKQWNSSESTTFKYKMIGIPMHISGRIPISDYLMANFYFGLNASLALSEFYEYVDNVYPPNQREIKLQKLFLFYEFGTNFEIHLKNNFSLTANIMARSTLLPVYRSFPIGGYWVFFSSFNFGLGLKYNIK